MSRGYVFWDGVCEASLPDRSQDRAMDAVPAPRPLERFLNIFTEVRRGEAASALLLALNIFLILTAYYVLKPVREALILVGGAPRSKATPRRDRPCCC